MFLASIPSSKKDLENYYKLRYEVLRKPWNQPLGSEKDDQENESFHAFIKVKSEVVAVCRMQMNSAKIAQIRYMGVRTDQQGKGFGKTIIRFLEEKAKEEGAHKMILHARENAVEFYKANGYKLVEESYLLWDEIQHYLMEKKLK